MVKVSPRKVPGEKHIMGFIRAKIETASWVFPFSFPYAMVSIKYWPWDNK
ncbi:MAG: hypothetical protein ABIN18_26150 [Pseudomonadota bacterium]